MTGRQRLRKIHHRAQLMCLPALLWLFLGGYILHSILGDEPVMYLVVIAVFLALTAYAVGYSRARYRCPYYHVTLERVVTRC